MIKLQKRSKFEDILNKEPFKLITTPNYTDVSNDVHIANIRDYDYDIEKTTDGRGIEIESKKLKENAKLIPDGVAYERLSVLLLDYIQRQEKRILNLEAKLLNQ